MSRLSQLASQREKSETPLAWTDWHNEVRTCVETASSDEVVIDDLSSAWAITGWAEVAATLSVRVRDASLIASGLAGLSIVAESEILDLRDLLVVTGLFRRSIEILNVEANSVVTQAGSLLSVGSIDNPVLKWTAANPVGANSGHEEIGAGPTFAFKRLESGVDVEALLKWVKDNPG